MVLGMRQLRELSVIIWHETGGFAFGTPSLSCQRQGQREVSYLKACELQIGQALSACITFFYLTSVFRHLACFSSSHQAQSPNGPLTLQRGGI